MSTPTVDTYKTVNEARLVIAIAVRKTRACDDALKEQGWSELTRMTSEVDESVFEQGISNAYPHWKLGDQVVYDVVKRVAERNAAQMMAYITGTSNPEQLAAFSGVNTEERRPKA